MKNVVFIAAAVLLAAWPGPLPLLADGVIDLPPPGAAGRRGRARLTGSHRRDVKGHDDHVDDVLRLELRVIGVVRSPLRDPADAPRQGDEGAPPAHLLLDPEVWPGLDGLRVGEELLVLTWLHHADRNVLVVHPRGDVSRPRTGVFSTRSPHRPNPLGLHRVTVVAIDGLRVQVRDLEAIDGTPIVDVKPVLGPVSER